VDLLDIVIVAAAAVGVIAFITLAVVIVLQGRALKRLEDRVGPPVPMGAAPSLERVRAIASQPEVRVDIPADVAAEPPVAQPAAGAASASQPDAAAAAAASAAAARAAERGGQRTQGSDTSSRPSPGSGTKKPSSGKSGGGNGALIALAGVVAIAVIAVGVWFLFLRGGESSTPATAGTSTTATSTTGTTGGTATAPETASAVPTDVPPVANKAAYTVAVLNASGVSGAAANRVAPRVQAAGYTLGVVDNAAQQDLVTSVVQYVAGRKEVAWNVAKDLGITSAGPVDVLSQGRIGTADVVVIVGKDLSK
jgi:hypothetical protein